ncbi:MAG: HAD family hydrolase [Desulfobulbaceae bacterium A2]|nr:MAG: HAD family hydrolase [Desulfobulbaceae bacterium A2]
MSFRAVLFDLDGTLLDTLEDLARATNRALARHGLPEHPVDAYRYFVGDGLRTLITRVLPEPRREEATSAAVMAAFQEEYGRSWHERSAPYPGVAAMLDALAAQGVSLNVLSNKPDAFTRLCVDRLLKRWRFEQVRGQREGTARKPDPSAALEIAAELGRTPAEVLYLGDTATDMRTATAAGMFPVGALWGFRTADELQQHGARALVAEPAELLQFFSSIE